MKTLKFKFLDRKDQQFTLTLAILDVSINHYLFLEWLQHGECCILIGVVLLVGLPTSPAVQIPLAILRSIPCSPIFLPSLPHPCPLEILGKQHSRNEVRGTAGGRGVRSTRGRPRAIAPDPERNAGAGAQLGARAAREEHQPLLGATESESRVRTPNGLLDLIVASSLHLVTLSIHLLPPLSMLLG